MRWHSRPLRVRMLKWSLPFFGFAFLILGLIYSTHREERFIRKNGVKTSPRFLGYHERGTVVRSLASGQAIGGSRSTFVDYDYMANNERHSCSVPESAWYHSVDNVVRYLPSDPKTHIINGILPEDKHGGPFLYGGLILICGIPLLICATRFILNK